MNTQVFGTLFLSTLQKEIRGKTFIFIFVLTVIVLGGMIGLFNIFSRSEIYESMADMVGKNYSGGFFLFISWWSGILAILFSCGCIRSDIQDRVIDQILSFPIKRSEYFLARWLGALSMTMGYFFFFSLVGLIAFGQISDNLTVGPGALLSFVLVSLLPLAAFSLLSVFLSLYFGRILSFMGIFVLTWIIRLVKATLGGGMLDDFNFWKGCGVIIHWLFPRTSTWDKIALTHLTSEAIADDLLWETGHYVLTMGFWLGLSLWVLRRKQF